MWKVGGDSRWAWWGEPRGGGRHRTKVATWNRQYGKVGIFY